eukprot:5724666-Amphidinium_carterae.2
MPCYWSLKEDYHLQLVRGIVYPNMSTNLWAASRHILCPVLRCRSRCLEARSPKERTTQSSCDAR